MGVNRNVKHVIPKEVIKNARSYIGIVFPRNHNITDEEIKEIMDSVGIYDEGFQDFINKLPFLVSELGLSGDLLTALKELEREGLSPAYLAKLWNKNIRISYRRDRWYRRINVDDAKLLCKNNENPDDVYDILNIHLTIPEYYKLKKATGYDRDFIKKYKEDFKYVFRNIPAGKKFSKAKTIFAKYGILKREYSNLDIKPSEIIDAAWLVEMGNGKLLEEMMTKYSVPPRIIRYFDDKRKIEEYIKYTSNLDTDEKVKLLNRYDVVIKEHPEKKDVILTFLKNGAMPQGFRRKYSDTGLVCSGWQIGRIACKYCGASDTCPKIEVQEKVTKGICGNCVFFEMCPATYKNLVDGKCNFKRISIPTESSTLRRRF